MTKPFLKHSLKSEVYKVYRIYGNKPFTAKEASAISDIKYGGTFVYLRERGIIRLLGNAKRGHYHSYPNGATRWVFTDSFLKYMKNGGLEELESQAAH